MALTYLLTHEPRSAQSIRPNLVSSVFPSGRPVQSISSQYYFILVIQSIISVQFFTHRHHNQEAEQELRDQSCPSILGA